METMLVPVEVPLLGDERRKNWAKVVSNVDEEKSAGWAFEGEFIAAGGIQDVAAPCVVLVYGERGSRANPQIEAQVFVANTDGTLSHHATATGRAWARTLRDTVADLCRRDHPLPTGRDWEPTLMAFSSQALEQELARRTAAQAAS